MKPVRPVHPGAPDVIYRSPHPDIEPLPAVRAACGCIVTRWELTDEDRARIAAGGSLYLRIHIGDRPLPPVALSTESPFLDDGGAH